MRFEALADRLHPLFASLAVVRRGAHLDEFMRVQRAVDLRDDLVREPLFANEDDGMQLVRLCAKRAAPRRGQGLGHGRILRPK